MRDRRKEPRLPAYLGGRIAFAQRCADLDCLVRNTSPGGARLAIENAGALPDEFDLAIPHRQTEMRVRARWRRFDAVGVEVVASAQAASLSLARLRKLERENAALKRRLGRTSV